MTDRHGAGLTIAGTAMADDAPALDTSKQVEIVMYYLGTEPAGQQVLSGKLIAAPNCKLKQTFWNQPLLKQSHCLLVIQHDI